ncbi:uncharacterized protein KGF55_004358 [Candida pseudojiufengensis]|uniref:uncharacterized protein n=1 Tax=Candida pseudojiufengensis TaxID=497109 RepID=UPI002224569D|nr:uncharacterized protein KGF55_004358 [Candida pseudojiufengensis]KAI5960788.1 hypothetical protein KGF55_004358 [Candida pseudojiufengensis]
MKIFLQLPEELLFLIIKYINDRSKIEQLIEIPALQQYAIKERYSKFKLDETSYSTRDGSIQTLNALFKQYGFKPTRIIGNTKDIHKLLHIEEKKGSSNIIRRTRSQVQNSGSKNELIDYSQVDYEILYYQSNISKLEDICKNANLVSIDVSQNYSLSTNTHPIREREFAKLLDIINASKLESLSTVYSNQFKVVFSNSLKKLKLSFKGEEIELNLSELANLELFYCYGLNGVGSLDDIQLPKTIKNLELRSCRIQVLGNMEQYFNLRKLTVDYCDALFQLMKSSFPKTLEEMKIVNSISNEKVAELFRAVSEGTNTRFEDSDFSVDGRRFLIGHCLKRLPKLRSLWIKDEYEALEVRVLNLEALSSLRLEQIKNVDLKEVLSSLPKIMFKIEIVKCTISSVESAVFYPESKHIVFSNNNLNNIFRSNFNNLKKLENLELNCNKINSPTGMIMLDSCELLKCIDEDFETSTGVSKKKVGKKRKIEVKDTVTFGAPKLEQLQLSNKNWFWGRRRQHGSSRKHKSLVSQVSLIECTNLKQLSIRDTVISVVDLNKLPNSLVSLSITNNKLKLFKGEFSNLSNLSELDLNDNEINYSMLANQTFPQSLKSLDLSENEIEDLTCLYLDNCVNLRTLLLVKVTGVDEPEGANELKKLFLKINIDADTSRGSLTNRKSKIIFNIVDGVDLRQGSSTLGSGSKKRKRVNDDPAYR